MANAQPGIFVIARRIMKNSTGRLVWVLCLTACSVSVVSAQTKNCECKFDTQEYVAYGTNGACGCFMYNKNRTCEISFAGGGANGKLLSQTLGDEALKSQFEIAPIIFKQYLTFERTGDKSQLLDPTFIERSLVVLERGAIFRESSASSNLSLKDIDKLFVDFSKTEKRQISDTFAGRSKPFSVVPEADKKAVFSVGLGYVELNFHDDAKVRVVYFSQESR